MSWEKLLIYFLLGVLPWIFVVAGAWLVWSAHQFMSRAVKVRGTVVNVRTKMSTSSSSNSNRPVTSYQPEFEYVDAGGNKVRGATFLFSTSYNFPVGTEKEILADPENPDKVRMPGAMIYGFGAILAGVGLVFGIVGIFAIQAM